MRAVLLGTGSPPPNPKRRGPATLLTLRDEQFLVDAAAKRQYAGPVTVGEDLLEV